MSLHRPDNLSKIVSLGGAMIIFIAPSFIPYHFIPCRKILAEEKVEYEIEATPWRSGTTFVVAAFNANELYNITGAKKVNIIS